MPLKRHSSLFDGSEIICLFLLGHNANIFYCKITVYCFLSCEKRTSQHLSAWRSSPCFAWMSAYCAGMVVVLLVLLCFLNGEARGQSCVPFKGSPATGGKCNTIITFANIYLPPGQHFQQVKTIPIYSPKLISTCNPY